MKKIIKTSLLTTFLVLAQPLLVFADTEAPRAIDFDDIESIVTEQNVNIHINDNSSLKDKVDLSDIKKTIRDLENDIEDIDKERDQARNASNLAQVVALGAEKSALLDALKEAERGEVDKPTAEAMIDLKNTMSNDSIIRSAEDCFINYNQLNSGISTISTNIEILQKKLVAMQLRESLGMVSHNEINNLKTTLVDLQTQLESMKFQQEAIIRQLKILINEQDSTLVIGNIPSVEEDFINEDQEADLAKALESSYDIKLKELQITMDQAALDRAKKDHGTSSKEYKKENYDLVNSNLSLEQSKDKIKASYYTMIDNISKLESDLHLAEQILEDKKTDLSEAKLKMSLGMISQLELDDVNKDYQTQEDALKAKQVDLFNAKCNYEWFLRGMPQS